MKDECFLLAASTVLRCHEITKQVEEIKKADRGLDMQPVRKLIDDLSSSVDAARDEKYITPEQYVSLSGLLKGIKDQTPLYENDYLRMMTDEDYDVRNMLENELNAFFGDYSMFMIEAVAQCECGTVKNRLKHTGIIFKEPEYLPPQLLGEEETTDGDEVNGDASRN